MHACTHTDNKPNANRRVAPTASRCFFRGHTTLTPIPAPVSKALADPTSGPVTAHYSTTLPCPAVPSGFQTRFHVPSFSRKLVGVRSLVISHVGVWIEPSSETTVCGERDTYASLATFTAELGSGLYTPHNGPRGQQQPQPQPQQQQHLLASTTDTAPRHVPPSHQVAMSHQVAVSGLVPVSGPVAASCSCRSLAHPIVLWHHRLGHPSIPRLRAVSSHRLVLGILRVLPLLPPSLAPPCGPCVDGRLRTTPHSSSLRPATEPFETLHLDVWGTTACPSLKKEIFFLLVVDDYSRYTTMFPLAKKSKVNSTLNRWLLTTADTRDHRANFLHSDREGEFCSGVLAGIRRLVMEIARTSLTHAHTPYFLWPYVVQYTAH
ncbi:unnamed protein product [Closterium sp. NIES-54]